MIILSLDTTTAAGSAAVWRDGRVLERAGDGTHTHGERLPRELMRVLEEASIPLDAVDRFAVAIGPGSFTGLRVGIATIQGLALAHDRPVAPVSAFEALAWSVRDAGTPIAAWMDARRGEVFATLFAPDARTTLHPATSLSPGATLDAWRQTLARAGRVTFVGDGAVKYAAVIAGAAGIDADVRAVPLLAGAIAAIAAEDEGRAVPPHALVPLYVRRPDAEIARERRHGA
ncbi:MAG TPA: tRNA (adenosine(37)-N6)-threonylcarbamoyltransferase complex dimerization subunit type 1 TsaB [Vicinamibacterales bacterium]|nr:tRNA (adenosine(37)-N6)-threonylcarbamoyltransferase complex dimerization subunit type 1 TsaB [Vicinamibacterales bacterium]